MRWCFRSLSGLGTSCGRVVAVAFAATLICAGCAYEVRLIPREEGEPTHISKVWVDSFGEAVSGSIELVADGIRYSGTYVSSPSGYGLTILSRYCPQHGDLARSTSGWYGQAFLHAPGGRTLQCEYKGSWSKGGYGVCLSHEGKVYDMLISR
jgi:hypothetical protein